MSLLITMKYKKESYSRDRSFIDRDGNFVQPSKEHYEKNKITYGTAYAFFDCDASKDELEKLLPDIRRDVQTASNLELKLHEGIAGLEFDEDLVQKIGYADDYRIMPEKMIQQGYEEERRPLASLRYVMIAQQVEETNKSVAGELAGIVNCTQAYNQSDIFRGAISYEENGEYVLYE